MASVTTSILWRTMAAGSSSGTMHTARNTVIHAGLQVSNQVFVVCLCLGLAGACQCFDKYLLCLCHGLGHALSIAKCLLCVSVTVWLMLCQ